MFDVPAKILPVYVEGEAEIEIISTELSLVLKYHKQELLRGAILSYILGYQLQLNSRCLHSANLTVFLSKPSVPCRFLPFRIF